MPDRAHTERSQRKRLARGRLFVRAFRHWQAHRRRAAVLHAYRVPLTAEQRAELDADRALTRAAARVVLARGADLERRYSRAAER